MFKFKFIKKNNSFNFAVRLIDGHNHKQIKSGLDFLHPNNKKSKLLIVQTVKGKGVSFMENKPEWHYWQKMNDVTKKKMLKELNGRITTR